MAKVIYDVKKNSYGKLFIFDIVTIECNDSEVNDKVNNIKNVDHFAKVQDIDFDNHVVRVDLVPKTQDIKKVYEGQFEEMLKSLETSDWISQPTAIGGQI